MTITIQKLSKYYYIKNNIASLKERIEEVEGNYISSSNLDGMPKVHNSSNPLEIRVTKIISLKTKLQKQLDNLLSEEIFIQDFINDVEDVKVQTIVRLRFIELMEWEEVGKIVYKFCDKTAPINYLKNYLRKYNSTKKEVSNESTSSSKCK